MEGFSIITLLLFLLVGYMFGGRGPIVAFFAWIIFMAITMISYAFSKGTDVGIVFLMTTACSILTTFIIARRINKSDWGEIFAKEDNKGLGCLTYMTILLLSFYLYGSLFKFIWL